MKRVIAARPRISERTWLLLILPVLWLFVIAWGPQTEIEAEEPLIIEKAKGTTQ